MNIAVYCGSVCGVDPAHAILARIIGEWIGENGHTLVYGGSDTGLMGLTADAALSKGGQVIGVLPDVPLIREHAHRGISRYCYTQTVSQRKQKMMELADAYIALPGGTGTLDEITEVISQNRLGQMRKSAVLVNAGGFYDALRQMLLTMIDGGFLKGEELDMLLFSDDPKEIAQFIEENHIRRG